MADGTEDTRNWFLRIASGTIFGPVSTQGLITWAEQGRVLAGNAISTDRKNWQSAESLPELNIAWYVEDAGGQLVGPFHRRAAEKIVEEGLPEGATRLVAAADADLSRLRKPTVGKRDGRSQDGHPELDLDSAPASKETPAMSPAAWVEERESLRLRIAELEAQGPNLLRAAEKEAKTHARQLESARRQVAALERELEELRLVPTAAVTADEAEMADTERQALEQVLETCVELQGEIDRLQAQIAKQQEERDQERTASAELQGEIDRLQAQIAKYQEERDQNRSERDALLSARQDVDALKVRIAELGGQIAQQDADHESVEDCERQCVTLEASLQSVRDSYAELIEFSNSRDNEHLQELERAEALRADLQAQLDAATAHAQSLADKLADEQQQEPARLREISARLREQETLLAGIFAEDLQAIEKVLATERESFALLRDSSLQRQSLLQARLTAIQKMQGGETIGVYEREAKVRSDKANSAKLHDELVALQAEHARYARQAETREHELVSRVRLLELEEERLKDRASEAEPLYQRNQHLTELLQDREKKLAQERQQRSIEQAQLEQAHQALIAQMESRKQAEETLKLKPGEGGQPNAAQQPQSPSFRVTPWMRLKK